MSEQHEQKFRCAYPLDDAVQKLISRAHSVQRIEQVHWTLSPSPGWSLRLRKETNAAGEVAWTMTIKSRHSHGDHSEYPVVEFGADTDERSEAERQLLFDNAASKVGKIVKDRHHVVEPGSSGIEWKIDVFRDLNEGLIIAETRGEQPVSMPTWAEMDVTGEVMYSNESLASHPKRHWT